MKATTAFGVGAVIGAALAVLLAPRTAKRVREGLEDVTSGLERGQARLRDIADQALQVTDQVKDGVERVRDALTPVSAPLRGKEPHQS